MGKRQGRKLPTIPPWEDILRLLRATTTERDRLILMVGAFCGCRVSEIVHLQVSQLDFSRKMIFLKECKGKKDRVVPMPKVLIGPLRAWVAGRKGPVFLSRKGGALSTRGVQLLVKRVAVKAGFANAGEPRAWVPHLLRHSAASRWLDCGASIVEVRDLLGHSSIAVTDRYAHANPRRLTEVVNR
jgi:integrase